MGDLASRRGSVQTTENQGHTVLVKACVPMVEMLEYASRLTSLTGGKGEFHMQFSHYDPMPPKLAEKVVADTRPAIEPKLPCLSISTCRMFHSWAMRTSVG